MTGRKDDAGKARYELIPPAAFHQLAQLFTLGAVKYGDRNWEAGLAYGRVFSALQRHAWAWWRGETHDPEDGQHHLASVMWCAMILLEYEIGDAVGNDDRPNSKEDANA